MCGFFTATMTSRGQRLVQIVRDREILNRLQAPPHESTKGTTARERNKCIARKCQSYITTTVLEVMFLSSVIPVLALVG